MIADLQGRQAEGGCFFPSPGEEAQLCLTEVHAPVLTCHGVWADKCFSDSASSWLLLHNLPWVWLILSCKVTPMERGISLCFNSLSSYCFGLSQFWEPRIKPKAIWGLTSQEIYPLPYCISVSLPFLSTKALSAFSCDPTAPCDQAAASRLVNSYMLCVKLNIFLHL